MIQQLYDPSANATVLVNLFLLIMNLLELAPLLQRRFDNKLLYGGGIGFIGVLAFLFNIAVGGVPTPLSNFKAFLNSMCGLWTAVLAVELLCLCLRSWYKAAWEQSSGEEDTDGTSSESDAEQKHSDQTDKADGKTGRASNGKVSLKEGSTKATTFLMVFAALTFFLPFANWKLFSESGWIGSVHAINQFVYNQKFDPAPALLLYLLSLFVILIAAVVGWNVVKYVLARHFSHSFSQDDFFEQYGTSIVVLVIAGSFVLAIQNNPKDLPSNGSSPDVAKMLGYITTLFAYMLCIIVAIIALLVAFETIRLVLNQCTKRGSLLKGSMQLIFILIVQYVMGLLMGILRMFALRDVIESLLLFALPDLEQSVEPDTKEVLNAALKRETRQVANDMGIAPAVSQHHRHKKGGRRITRKRRRGRK